jgi:hypothetical protein
MKLGLILKITNGGESETFSINKQEAWARYASDARTAIKELQGFDGSDKTVYLLKFLGSIGYLLSVIKSRPEGSGRPNDNTAAWIFFPSAAVVSATEMEQVLEKVEEAISESKGVDNAKLEETFSTDYATKNVLVSAVGTISSAAEGNYALRYYNGDYNLNELLGENLAQSEYARYKGVFFAENNSGIRISTNGVLSFEPKQFITISPLKSVGGFVAGFSLPKGFAKFDKDIELATGTQITIEWRKENYAPIVKQFTAGIDNTASLEIKDTERFVRIQRSWFKVQDSHGISIQKASVSINHRLITGDYLDIAESLLPKNGIPVDIQANGYEDSHKMLQKIPTNMVVELHHRVYESEYIVPIYDGEKHICDAKLTVSAKQRISKSPLKGYEIEHPNILVYSVGFMSKFKTFVYGFISCLLVILLYVGAQAMEEYEFQFGWPPFKHIVQQESEDNNPDDGDVEGTPSDSIKNHYLDTSKSWNKDSLDAHEETMGLFDELNEFKLDALKNRIAEKKLSSQNLQNIVDALQRNYDNGYDPHIGKMSNGGNYNNLSDKTINIDNYIKWLSIQHKEPTHEDKPVTDTDKKETSKVSTSSKITGKKTKATDNKKVSATDKTKTYTSKSDDKKVDTPKKNKRGGE